MPAFSFPLVNLINAASLAKYIPSVHFFKNSLIPTKEKLRKSMISVWKLEEGECHLDVFDRKRKPKMTTIKEYREQSIELELTAGRYMIVPR